jgi:hypothetical protein
MMEDVHSSERKLHVGKRQEIAFARGKTSNVDVTMTRAFQMMPLHRRGDLQATVALEGCSAKVT